MPFLLTGCESLIEGLLEDDGSSGGGHSRGVKLSQAMESSASGSREPLHGSGSRQSHYSEPYTYQDTSTDEGLAIGAGSGKTTSSAEEHKFSPQVPFDVAYSVPFSGEFKSITRITLTPICIEDDLFSVGFFVGGDLMKLKSGTLAASAIDDPWMLEMGIAGRLYLNRAHVFVSPYLSANMACQVLFWDYKNPVYVDGDEIRSDTLPAFGGYTGFGLAFNRNEHLSFFGEVGVGGTVFVTTSGQGFYNDVFSNFAYFSVKAGLCVKF